MPAAPDKRVWEHGDYVCVRANGSPSGCILDMHDDGTVTILRKNGETSQGPVIGRGRTDHWSPHAYGYNEGCRDAIRALRALKLLS